MLIKVALNGARSKSENEFVPHSLEEITTEVKSLYELGYFVFHIHCYDENGNESLAPYDVANLVSRVKNISPDIQVGISTGEWIVPDFDQRVNLIKNWTILPDFASVNMIEDRAIEISKTLAGKGVLIEAGLNEKKAAEIFIKSGLEKDCVRVLIEPESENIEEALIAVSEIEEILNLHKSNVKRLLHGFNSAAWDLAREAKRKNYDTRIGMEDIIFSDNGNKIKSNSELLKYAENIIS